VWRPSVRSVPVASPSNPVQVPQRRLPGAAASRIVLLRAPPALRVRRSWSASLLLQPVLVPYWASGSALVAGLAACAPRPSHRYSLGIRRSRLRRRLIGGGTVRRQRVASRAQRSTSSSWLDTHPSLLAQAAVVTVGAAVVLSTRLLVTFDLGDVLVRSRVEQHPRDRQQVRMTTADLPVLSAPDDGAAVTVNDRRRRLVRGRARRPWWVRSALLATVGAVQSARVRVERCRRVAGAMSSTRPRSRRFHELEGVSLRSHPTPATPSTVDKPPASLWLPELSVRRLRAVVLVGPAAAGADGRGDRRIVYAGCPPVLHPGAGLIAA